MQRHRNFASGDWSGSYSVSARCRHAEPAREIEHVAQSNQAGAMFGGDRCGWAGYSARKADQKQRVELFMGERFRFRGHGSNMARFRN